MHPSDLTNGLMAGALAGAMMAGNRSDDRQSEWSSYVQQMEKRIGLLKGALDHRAKAFELQSEAYEESITELQEKERELRNVSVDKAELEGKYTALVEHMEKTLKRVKKLERSLQVQSANVLGLKRLYELLVSEINEISDPTKFKSLDPEKRREEIDRAYQEIISNDMLVYRDPNARPAPKP
jgi:chromosome segregation ATPase